MPPTSRLSRREEIARSGLNAAPTLPLLAIRGYLCFRCCQHHGKLRRCKGCQRAYYCSKACQINDWRVAHKNVCKVLQDINGIEGSEVPSNLDRDGYTNEIRHKVMFIKTCSRALPKDQEDDVTQIISAQPYCTSCYLTGYQLACKGVSLTTCETCHFVSNCEECPSNHTQDQCQHYSVIGQLETYRLRHFDNYGTVSFIQPVGVPCEIDIYRPLSSYDNWPDFFMAVPMRALHADDEDDNPEHFAISATEGSTISMTIVAALEAAIPNIVDKQTVTVHILSATSRESSYMLLFEDLLHLLPRLEHIHVVLCGPNVFGPISQPLGEVGQDMEMDCCPECTSMGRRRSMAFFKGPYHEYAHKAAFKKPDLAVLFNSGKSQEAVETWAPTTRFLVDSAITTAYTTYTEREAMEEAAELEVLNARFIIRPEVNKWRGLVPWPELMEGEEHSSWYQNYYWYIFQGKQD